MRTSLNEIKLIDGYIFNNNPCGDALLFDAMLIIDPSLSGQITWQKKTHVLICQYSRKKIKAEIESVHEQLFKAPGHKTFGQKILDIFK